MGTHMLPQQTHMPLSRQVINHLNRLAMEGSILAMAPLLEVMERLPQLSVLLPEIAHLLAHHLRKKRIWSSGMIHLWLLSHQLHEEVPPQPPQSLLPFPTSKAFPCLHQHPRTVQEQRQLLLHHRLKAQLHPA